MARRQGRGGQSRCMGLAMARRQGRRRTGGGASGDENENPYKKYDRDENNYKNYARKNETNNLTKTNKQKMIKIMQKM